MPLVAHIALVAEVGTKLRLLVSFSRILKNIALKLEISIIEHHRKI